jgi:PAS domain S-box-containing protein
MSNRLPGRSIRLRLRRQSGLAAVPAASGRRVAGSVMVVGLAGLLLTISALVAGWFILHSRNRMIGDASRSIARTSQIVADQIAERIHLLDQVIQRSGEAYLTRIEANPPDTRDLDELLATQVASIGTTARVLGIVTPDGRTRYTSRGNPAAVPYTGDRTYFRRHAAGEPLLLSGPVISRSDGQPAFYLTRRLDDRSGRFSGVVFANIDPRAFQNDLARLGLPGGGRAILRTPDGSAIARAPAAAEPPPLTAGDVPTFPIQADLPPIRPPWTAERARLEGDALVFETQLAGLPIRLRVTVPLAACLTLWYEDIQSIAAVALAVAIGLLAVLGGLHRQLRINDDHAAALAQARESLDAAQALAQLGSWRWDPSGRRLDISRQFAALFGCPQAAALRPGQVWRAVHPDDRPLLAQAWRGLLRTGTAAAFEVRITAADGTPRTLAVASRRMPPRPDGRLGAFGTVLDITHRKQIEQDRRRWIDAFENTAHGIGITDAATNTQLVVNPAYAAMHGMTVPDMVGRSVADFYPPGEEAERQAALRASDTTGHTEFDSVRIRKDGSRFRARIWLTTVRDGAGKPMYRISTISDITERKQIEQLLFQAQKMDAIGNLTGGIAHDFNNLIGIILLNLDCLRPLVQDNPQASELVSDSLAAALSGADLTQRLLGFARRRPLAPVVVSVNDLLADTVALMRRSLRGDIVVSVDLDPDLWPAFVDPAQLEASIINLATNARDAMPAGGRLHITTRNRTIDADTAAAQPDLRAGDYAMISISDSGVGMSAAVRDRIFEPFFTTKERGRGTGLGLSMVFGFMRQSNGLVTVHSVEGEGTTFRLYLPRSRQAVAAPPASPRRPVESGQGETILVVEDNDLLRSSIARQLTGFNYQVRTAAGADSALAELRREPADLVLTDVVMPGELDGIALARTVLTRWPGTKVVLTTGFSEGQVNRRLAELGPTVKMLHKPYRRDDLAQTIRTVLLAA